MEIANYPVFNGYESTVISALNTSFTDHPGYDDNTEDEEARLYLKIHMIKKTTGLVKNTPTTSSSFSSASASTHHDHQMVAYDFSVQFTDVWDPRDGGPSQLRQQLNGMVGEFGGNQRSWSALKDWISTGAQDMVRDMMVECIRPRDLCVYIQVHFITFVDDVTTDKRGRKRKRFHPH